MRLGQRSGAEALAARLFAHGVALLPVLRDLERALWPAAEEMRVDIDLGD